MTRKIQTITLWSLGLLMIVFGLNKFLGFLPVAPPQDAVSQQFLSTMFSSYLFVLVAIGEIIGGLLLLVARTRKWGFYILVPIVVNIVAFHLAHDFIGNGIWLVPTLLTVVLLYLEITKDTSLNILKNE